jgi:hypothetical protein
MDDYLSLSWSVQGLIRSGFALCMLGMLCLSLPSARRFFGSEKFGGYADDEPFLNLIFSPLGRVVFLAAWIASACWLLVDKHTVLASLVCLLCCRFCFISLRWRSISRGMGAPGFMLYWLAALVFFLEYTRHCDPSGYLRALAILTFKVDFAVIMLCAGQYKLFSGYPQNNGMERGMVNPWWGRLRERYRTLPPDHIVFKFFNHCAYLGELVFGGMMLYAATAEAGALLMAGSFVFILCHIKLGFLCYTVIVSCFLFCHPGGLVDGLLPSVASPAAVAHPGFTVLNVLLGAFLLSYLVLLPFMKLGTYYNFYGKKRLPEKWQNFQDKWTNLWGIIIWRVFTIDNTNFYVKAYIEDRSTGVRELYSQPEELSLSKGIRYCHVCEFVCFVSIFTTLKYFPSNSPMFTKKLMRYARTIPHDQRQQVLVFQWLDIKKEASAFSDVASKEYRVDLQSEELTVTDLADGSTATDSLRFSELVEGDVVGSYAPKS